MDLHLPMAAPRSMSSRLQRSSVSFRRQGSSGRIWDDPLRCLDLKGLCTAQLHADDPFPPEPSSARSLRGGRAPSAGVIAESPDVAPSDRGRSPAGSVVVVRGADSGAHTETRPARRRRRLSSAFCACMGHPPASHAQQ